MKAIGFRLLENILFVVIGFYMLQILYSLKVTDLQLWIATISYVLIPWYVIKQLNKKAQQTKGE